MSQIATWRPKLFHLFGVWHHGVLLNDDTVVHYKVAKGGKKTQPVIERTTLLDFAQGCKVYDVHHFSKQKPYDEVEQRALGRLGRGEYSLLYNNCESFARWCVTGHEVSQQVLWLGCVPILGILSIPATLVLHCFTPAHFSVRISRKEIRKMEEGEGSVGDDDGDAESGGGVKGVVVEGVRQGDCACCQRGRA